LQAKFNELDTNGDGNLDFDELKDLLQKGNPAFKSNEVMKLYKKCDLNGDGKISFDEFLQYVYGKDIKEGKLEDDTEGDWGPCGMAFEAFCSHGHKDMEGKEFAKFCKDNHIVKNGFKNTDIDLIFAKVVPKGKRRMDFEQFKQACRHIALKRTDIKCNKEIQDLVAGAHGPELHGTKQDAVRFYDDKTTFTGAATHNTNFEGVDPNDPTKGSDGRHAAQQAEAKAKLAGGVEDDWESCKASFDAFAGPGGELDGKELLKLVEDCRLVGGGFTKQDCDITFASVARKAKKIDFEMFKDIVRSIASKKKKDVCEIQSKIAASNGPVIHATKTDNVRFHDDKSTYTGAHADVHGREGGHGDDRHEKLHAEHEAKTGADEGERPWDSVKEVFAKFAGTDGLDNREFAKFCKDANLISGNFNIAQVDLVFTTAVPKGQRRLNEETFCQAIREIASKKGCPTHQVQGQVSICEGPVIKGTEGASRFHDDKSTYTGMHTDK